MDRNKRKGENRNKEGQALPPELVFLSLIFFKRCKSSIINFTTVITKDDFLSKVLRFRSFQGC